MQNTDVDYSISQSEEIVDGEIQQYSACPIGRYRRRSAHHTSDSSRQVKQGSFILVHESLTAGCQEIKEGN